MKHTGYLLRRLAPKLQRETPRFIWGDTLRRRDGELQSRAHLIHTQEPHRFYCEIEDLGLHLRSPVANVNGAWLGSGTSMTWVCDEFVAFNWVFVGEPPPQHTLSSILHAAVADYRRYNQYVDEVDKAQRVAEQRGSQPLH